VAISSDDGRPVKKWGWSLRTEFRNCRFTRILVEVVYYSGMMGSIVLRQWINSRKEDLWLEHVNSAIYSAFSALSSAHNLLWR
jgi:hypothetical protein